MSTHALKTWPEYYQAVINGDKTFELRKADRDYKVGDRLLLQEWDPVSGKYTEREGYYLISYILSGEFSVLIPGYVLMSIREMP